MHDVVRRHCAAGGVQSNFGDTLEGSVSEIVVRNWGALIGLVGAMLIYGAYHPATRPLVLAVAGISELRDSGTPELSLSVCGCLNPVQLRVLSLLRH